MSSDISLDNGRKNCCVVKASNRFKFVSSDLVVTKYQSL